MKGFDELLELGLLGLAAFGVSKLLKSNADEKKRKSIYCTFSDGISLQDFEQLALLAAKQIKKKHIDVQVNGPVVLGTVQSQSGLSSWSFSIDFNDYGHITGTYWLSSENSDSPIPKHIADSMREFIIQRNRYN